MHPSIGTGVGAGQAFLTDFSHGHGGSCMSITDSAQHLSWEISGPLFVWSLLFDLVDVDKLFDGNILICTDHQSHDMVVKKVHQTDI